MSKRGENIYFICSNSDGASRNMFLVSACPVLVPYAEGNLAATNESELKQKEIYQEQNIEREIKEKTILSVSDWQKRLEECEYVFLMNVDEAFCNDYAELFIAPETMKNGTFYQVTKENGHIMLDYIGEVSVIAYL